MYTLSPENVFGLTPQPAPNPSAPSPLAASSSPGVTARNVARPWSPDSPLFWFAVLAAATFGLIGFSTHARIGRLRGELDIGDAE